MKGHCKNRTTVDPMPANPNFGTFTFLQPQTATAIKKVKEPKFSSRTATLTSIATESCIFIQSTSHLKYYDSS